MGIFGGSVGLRDPTQKLSLHQLLYIFGINGVGGLVISGGINFAIAYGMYLNASEPIWLFQLPTTLLGDAGVTTILQSIITWFITLLLVKGDLRSGGVAPIGFVKEPTNRLVRWLMFLPADDNSNQQERPSPTTRVDSSQQQGRASVFLSLLAFVRDQALRGFLFSIPFFAIMIGPTVGILLSHGIPSGGDWVYPRTWAPQIFKLLYGGILGMFMSPVFVLFWTVRCGWACQRGDSTYGERWIRKDQEEEPELAVVRSDETA